MCSAKNKNGYKATFHDIDTDSSDTPIHPYVRHARFLREDVGVGVVECGLYAASSIDEALRCR